MGSIFNEKVSEKWSLWVHEQCIDVLFMQNLVNNYGWEKKEEEENAKREKRRRVDTQTRYPNTHLV